ncbi:cytochrome P450 4F8-like [Crassostrea virginica]|uniref:Cytochrome P450 4F22-like n=1 Tax=Crassostrea virginica TaxID=6565 RepID=A0A8B8ESR0_CRAVI|nr:cytochrome P450 4F22-like [Crassostrea virginica]
MSGMLVTAAFTFLVVIIIRQLIKFIKLKNAFRGFPEPLKEKHWLLGHLPVFTGKIVAKSVIDLFLSWTVRFPKMFVLWFGPFDARVLLNHPETIKKVLKTADPKPVGFGQGYRHGIPWLGEGLLIAGGAKWKRSRRLLTPAFHFDILKPYVQIFKSCADKLTENIERSTASQESVEIYNLVSSCTLDIIMRCAFSYETDCQRMSGSVHPYIQAVNDISSIWSRRNRLPWLYPDFIFYLTPDGRKFKKQCDYVHTVAEGVIDNRRNTLESENLSSKKHLDFLDILLTAKDEEGKGMSKEDIRNEVDTFMFEGHDTTASAISWILYSLAENPDCQRQCQEEIDRVVSETKSGQLEWKDLNQLEYLSLCIKEGMRLHSPVPGVLRDVQSPIQVENVEIPARTTVMISFNSLHHNPAVWGKDHQEFKPERFLPENSETRDSFAFCPFSAGPRNCIGQNFAVSEEKTVLATLLQKFTFSVDKTHTVEKQISAVTRARYGIKLFAQPRQSA